MVQKSNVPVEFQPFNVEVIVSVGCGLIAGGVAAIPVLATAKDVASYFGTTHRVAVLLVGTLGLSAVRALSSGTLFGKGVEIATVVYAVLWGAGVPSSDDENEETATARHFIGTGMGLAGWAATRLLGGTSADLIGAALAAYVGASSIP